MSSKNADKVRESTIKELKKIAKKSGLLVHIENDKCVFGRDKKELEKNLAEFEVSKSEINKYDELHKTFMFYVDTSSSKKSDIADLAGAVLVRVHSYYECSFITITKAFDCEGCGIKSKTFDVEREKDVRELNKVFNMNITEEEFDLDDTGMYCKEFCELIENLTIPDMVMLYLKYVYVTI